MNKFIKIILKDISVDKENLKKFGLLLMSVMFILSLYAARNGHDILLVTAFILFFASALATYYDRWLYTPFLVWMFIARIIGCIVERIILFILYYLIFSIGGIVLRIFKRDILNKKIDRMKISYWINVEADEETSYGLPY